VTAALLALVLAVDAGTVDAGFEPIVLDVRHGTLFTSLPDGGFSDAPVEVVGGTYMDDATTMWVAENKARWRAEASVGPTPDLRTITVVGAVMFGLGIVVGGAVIFAWRK
jgi:hypothetical protein